MNLTYEKAEQIYHVICNSKQEELRRELFATAAKYAQYRVLWLINGDEDLRRDIDAERTRAHEAFIDACNILSRAMAKAGKDNTWRDTITNDRKVIGDFACYLALFLGLSAR